MNASDYVNADKDLLICDTFDNNENWREELGDKILSGGHAKKPAISESYSEEEDESDKESPSTITRFREKLSTVVITC